MNEKMRATIFHSPQNFSLEMVDVPVIKKPSEAIIRVTMNSICGSDIHLVNGITIVDPGTHMGHELVGVVEKVGDGVTTIKPGDRVVVPTFIHCGFCYYCTHGSPAQCENGGILGFGPSFGGMGGAWADYCHVPYADMNLHKIPDNLSDEDCIFIGDIISTAYFGLEKGMVKPGDSVAIIGPGPVGLCVQVLAPIFGAGKVIMIGTRDSRMEISEKLGAIPINPRKENMMEKIHELTDGRGADVVVECVGSSESWDMSVQCVRRGGNISLMGVFGEPVTMPIHDLSLRNHFIFTGLVNCDHIGEIIELISTKRIDTKFLITHRMKLDDIKEAYYIAENRIGDCLKVVVTP